MAPSAGLDRVIPWAIKPARGVEDKRRPADSGTDRAIERRGGEQQSALAFESGCRRYTSCSGIMNMSRTINDKQAQRPPRTAHQAMQSLGQSIWELRKTKSHMAQSVAAWLGSHTPRARGGQAISFASLNAVQASPGGVPPRWGNLMSSIHCVALAYLYPEEWTRSASRGASLRLKFAWA